MIHTWLMETALPLWREHGMDPRTGTAWEALSHSAVPLHHMERRLRVQLRQSYSFATLGETRLSSQLFRWVMQNGFDPETGNLAARLSPDMGILSAPHDLYDLAFAALAAAAQIRAGINITQDLARIEAAIDRLKAPEGWYEDSTHSVPRRQNPHMHLFEAFIELYDITGVTRFLDTAEECLALFRNSFLQADGRLLERFDLNWVPVEDATQTIEPGHMAEWIYLLDRYEEVTTKASNVDLMHLWQAVLVRRDATGLLPDHSDPISTTRRLWPQTELLKATCVMARRGLVPQDNATKLMQQIKDAYLTTPVPGGWYDKRGTDGSLLSENMPSSTFYHIVVAFSVYKSVMGVLNFR